MGRGIKGRAMGAARIAIGARMGAILGGAPCHCATAAMGNSAKTAMGSRLRIPHLASIGYSQLVLTEHVKTACRPADCKYAVRSSGEVYGRDVTVTSREVFK